MKQIYVCYGDCPGTKQKAATVLAALEQAGLSCFFASRDVNLAENGGRQRLTAMQECELMLLLLDKDSALSDALLGELDVAVGMRKSVLPVFLEDVTLNDDLRYYIGRKQWVMAYPEPPETYLNKILQTVTSLLPQPAPVRYAPPPPPAPTVAPPVEEQEGPFVFISYAHADKEQVLPLVAAMQQAGIRVWYDNGIEAGSEWPEYIARKVATCAKFVSFISKAYLHSQNCKRELNFAISRPKELLSAYIEEVELTLGMEMQLGTYQAMYMNRYGSPEEFAQALCRERFFNPCRQ